MDRFETMDRLRAAKAIMYRDQGRRSGQTFRAILRCMEMASGGKRVLYVSNHHPDHAINRALDIMGCQSMGDWTYDFTNKRMTIGRGSLRFQSLTNFRHEDYCGLRGSIVADIDDDPYA